VSVGVRMEDVSVALGGATILDGVSLDAQPGEFVTLLGPSGSGKTTTLNVLAGFVAHERGRVAIGDEVVDALPPHRRNIGFVFQSYALFPHMTVAQNVGYPLAARKVSRAERDRRVAEVLDLVQLPHAGDRAVRSLSGGQQQRIALARALVFEPNLLLLDEPLAALDKQLRDAMQLEVRRIHERTGMTTIAVTHDQVEAMTMSDRVVILDGGRISQAGTPEEVYEHPANLFVAGFLGEANLLPARDGRVAALGVATSGQRDGTAIVRPERLELTAGPDDGRPGVVSDARFQGTRMRLVVELEDGQTLLMAIPVDADGRRPARGERVHVRCTHETVHAVAEETPASTTTQVDADAVAEAPAPAASPR
jgi:putative spermidine/putrescine transport system ATP-binding protein